MKRALIASKWHAGLAALGRTGDPPPRSSRWTWAADTALALALGVGMVIDAVNPGREGGTPGGSDGQPPIPPAPGTQWLGVAHPYASGWVLVLTVLTVLPLALRRKYPLTVLWIVVIVSQLYHHQPGFDPVLTLAACVIAAYSATMYSPYRILSMASAMAGTALIVLYHKQDVPSAELGFVFLLLLIPIGLAANSIHVWRQQVGALEAEREAATRLAVQRERARISRELHDVVSHNVSVMTVQAGAARQIMATSPEKAHSALLAVEAGGRAAMAELRHVMGLLTMVSDGPDPARTTDVAPQPSLDQVPALADRVRATGVPVELTTTGAPASLPTGLDLAAYRVIQEALTNAVKHAVGASVRITVAYEPEQVRIEVTDTGGTRAATASTGNGRGLIGLRERLAIYDGTLEAGSRPDGGYRISAVLPLLESHYAVTG